MNTIFLHEKICLIFKREDVFPCLFLLNLKEIYIFNSFEMLSKEIIYFVNRSFRPKSFHVLLFNMTVKPKNVSAILS